MYASRQRMIYLFLKIHKHKPLTQAFRNTIKPIKEELTPRSLTVCQQSPIPRTLIFTFLSLLLSDTLIRLILREGIKPKEKNRKFCIEDTRTIYSMPFLPV